MFKIIAVTSDGKFFMETSFSVFAIEEFIRVHAEHLKKIEVVDADGNLLLFLDLKYFQINNLIPEDENEIPF